MLTSKCTIFKTFICCFFPEKSKRNHAKIRYTYIIPPPQKVIIKGHYTRPEGQNVKNTFNQEEVKS